MIRVRGEARCLGSAGFTLIELTIVILIVAILASASAPRFSAAIHRQRAEAAAQRIRADLLRLQSHAIASSTNQVASFSEVSNTYTMSGVESLNRPDQTYYVDLGSAPYHASILSVSLGMDSEIEFDRFGKPDSGGTISVVCGGTQQFITIENDSGEVTIP